MSEIAAPQPAGAGDDAEDEGALVDTADIPSGGQLRLMRYGEDYEILFGREQLMGSWASVSEEALATLVCERQQRDDCRILIGGLGMGFTLGAALAALPAEASVTVAELVPKIVAWASGPLSHIFGGSLDDPRVTIEIRDVHDIIDDATGLFDAILLDVDNGPDGLIQPENERLYCNWGLRAAHKALRPGGTLAVWSANPDPGFPDRLRAAGFAVEEVLIPADRRDGESIAHTIWLAARAAG